MQSIKEKQSTVQFQFYSLMLLAAIDNGRILTLNCIL